jgi:hypothetical protein
MYRWQILMIVLALSAITFPQSAVSQYPQQPPNNPPYQPVVPAPSTPNSYGGGGYWGGGGTVAGNAMNGMANVISAQGQRNLSNSAAAVNLTEARKNEIQNRQAAVNSYWSLRAQQRQAVAAERGPKPTMQEIAQIAKDGAPRPLAANQMDPVTGRLYWPSALQQDVFASQRQLVDQEFGMLAKYSALDYSGQMETRQAIKTMFSELKTQIDQIPQDDYMNCRNFLQRLMYAATGTSSLS